MHMLPYWENLFVMRCHFGTHLVAERIPQDWTFLYIFTLFFEKAINPSKQCGYINKKN